MRGLFLVLVWLLALVVPLCAFGRTNTTVAIVGDDFYINGQPTYAGRLWHGHRIQGLLLNSRMVQATFDDRNTNTVARWAYPDTGRWDVERNTREFIAAMPDWRRHGLLAVTVNLQGGSPEGYSSAQPWENSAFNPDGSLRTNGFARLEKILDRADELGMAVILGYFYFGQDQRLTDEAAVIRATDNTTHWLLEQGWRNVLVEIDNECNVSYHHDILKPARVSELISRVQRQQLDGRRLLVSTSYGGGAVPGTNIVGVADFLLLHGNGMSRPAAVAELVRKTRALCAKPKPILFNEDDHYDFDRPQNNFTVAVGEHASWGFFDYRRKGEGFDEGYQSVPVNWGISSARKREFFQLVAEITGSKP
ncbi:MAG TPA: hypothetical protein VKS19_05070 [Verrucomicrobiae bacterium]|nr:hypothetical protein [Verrucomicrobiae bacterium]